MTSMASADPMPSTRSGGREPVERRRRAQRLDVSVVDTYGHPVRMRRLTCWLQRVAPFHARGSVSIGLLSDRSVRGLNRRYRQIDSATDVLSFPAEMSSPPRRTRRTRKSKPDYFSASSASSVVESFLGDIAIARGVARRQARAARHAELTELRLLALHGLLHLLGYDHERDEGEMRRVERRLRRKGGLREGLIERQRPAAPRPPDRRHATRQ